MTTVAGNLRVTMRMRAPLSGVLPQKIDPVSAVFGPGNPLHGHLAVAHLVVRSEVEEFADGLGGPDDVGGGQIARTAFGANSAGGAPGCGECCI
ncbi:MAG: hypothetical protein AAGF74_03425 [Pseudomonadota bacterium]